MSESLFLIKRATALLAFALLCLFQSDGCLAGESKVRLERLRCESRTDPLGIDETAPRLGWLLQSEERGQRQTAYRILVASSTSRLAAGQADLWDSGKVTSDNNTAVVYAGKPLKSGQSCHWKVMAWDAQERSTAWSKPALWSMGLLEPEDWEAEWIGYDAERVVESQDADFEDCQWICHADDPAKDAPAGHRLYVARFELPEEARVEQAEVLAVADDQLWMAVNEKMVVHGEPGWQRVKPVSVADVLKPGTNELRFNIKNDSPGPTGLLVRLTIKLASGKEIKIRSDQSWFSCGNPGQHWPAEPLDESKVKPAQTIGPYGIKPWGTAKLQGLFLPPVPLLRTEFDVAKTVQSANLYVTALGNADAYLNGKRVSEEYFTPGWTDYSKRVYYRTYDVTQQINQGKNALGGTLADGWFSGYIGWGRNRDHYGKKPRLKMQLDITYMDGTTETFGTGADWKATAGPTREADFLMGERYDARLALPDWAEPGIDQSAWKPVDVGTEFRPSVEAAPGPPVGKVSEFSPVSITQPRPDTYVFDLGQNFAGVVQLKVSGEQGQQIRLRFAERLNPDGTLYTT
ncbi:MAG: family 78 glycoside hydrolase catalytic domain, partial [Lacipirellulaceae bacterium]